MTAHPPVPKTLAAIVAEVRAGLSEFTDDDQYDAGVWACDRIAELIAPVIARLTAERDEARELVRIHIDPDYCRLSAPADWAEECPPDNPAVHFNRSWPAHGLVRIEEWPEGLVLWVGGEIKWKSWTGGPGGSYEIGSGGPVPRQAAAEECPGCRGRGETAYGACSLCQGAGRKVGG